MTRKDGSQHYAVAPLAGVTAGTAAVLFAFGVLCLAWRQVSGHVSLAITMLAYAVIAGLAVVTGAFAWLAVLWVAHRHRHPELLAGRRVVRAEALDAGPPSSVPELPTPPAEPAAIEPPRVYLTDAQFAALMVTNPQLPRGDQDRRSG